MEIGFFISKNAEELFTALGYENLSPGNTENQVKAVVEYVNAHGGLAGRRIEPVFGVWDATAGNTVAQREAACSTWLEDHKVAAVVAESFDTFQACTTKARVPLLFGNTFPVTDGEFARSPMMATTTQPSDERLLPAWVDGLNAARYFAPWGALPVKIGVMYLDTPAQRHSFETVLEPALARHGQSVGEEAALSSQSIQEQLAAIQNTVLRFRAANVTHVVIMDTGGIGTVFMPQAESQGYRPKYGLHSLSQPAIMQDIVPKEQLAGATAMGWLPTVDVANPQRPEPNRTLATCLEIMTEAGEDMSSAARGAASVYCDMTFVLAAAAAQAPTFTSEGLLQGLSRVGRSYESTTTFAEDFSTRRDGPAALRPLAFDPECDCFAYTSDQLQPF